MPGTIIKDATERMEKTVEHLTREFAGLRAGRANPAMLDRIMVDYYGTPTPIKQLATSAYRNQGFW